MWENCLNPKSVLCLAPNEIIDTGGYHLMTARLFSVIGLISLILGITSDAVKNSIGLESISWFLVAIVFFIAAIPCCLGWAVAVYLKNKKG
jgi:hypothetical protein